MIIVIQYVQETQRKIFQILHHVYVLIIFLQKKIIISFVSNKVKIVKQYQSIIHIQI